MQVMLVKCVLKLSIHFTAIRCILQLLSDDNAKRLSATLTFYLFDFNKIFNMVRVVDYFYNVGDCFFVVFIKKRRLL